MGRMSNRERIARAAQEAELTAKEKEATKAARAAAAPRSRSRASKVPVRMKIVWQVASGETVVATFAYPDKPAAESKAAELTASSKRLHSVRPAKVPME